MAQFLTLSEYRKKLESQLASSGNLSKNWEGNLPWLWSNNYEPPSTTTAPGTPPPSGGTTPSPPYNPQDYLTQSLESYKPGGSYSQYMTAEWETAKKKAGQTYQQNLISSGLGGTTMMGKAAPGYGATEERMYQLGTSYQREQMMANVYKALSDITFQQKQLAQQKQLSEAEMKLQEKLAKQEADLRKELATMTISASTQASKTPTSMKNTLPTYIPDVYYSSAMAAPQMSYYTPYGYTMNRAVALQYSRK